MDPNTASWVYLVMNADGGYWTGDGWSSDPDSAMDLVARAAAEIAIAHAPSDILIGGDLLPVDLGAGSQSHCVWVDYPDRRNELYDSVDEAVAGICAFLAEREKTQPGSP